MNSATRAEAGISLIELLVVMAVISILVGFAIPQWHGVAEKNRARATKGMVEAITAGMEMYKFNHDGYPATGAINNTANIYQLLSPYLSRDPKGIFSADGFADYKTTSSAYTLVVKARTRTLTYVTGTSSRVTANYNGEDL